LFNGKPHESFRDFAYACGSPLNDVSAACKVSALTHGIPQYEETAKLTQQSDRLCDADCS
jgi:hypothetical protein